MRRPISFTIITLLILVIANPLGLFSGMPVKGEPVSWENISTGLPTNGDYFGVTIGDVNNDDHLDVVVASDGDGVRVFLGDGTGSWSAVASHPEESGGFGDITLGDYDDDGNLDIFVGSPGNRDSTPTGIHVYKGDGSGGFSDVTSSSNLPTTGKWRGVAVGDVNKDGHLDLAATNGYSTTDGLHVYTGDGTGTFTDNSTGLPTDEDRGSSVILADLNNDNNLDVAAGGAPGVDVFLGNGGAGGTMSWTASSSGLPSERYTGIEAVDLNNDGSLDLVLSAYNAGSGVGVRAYRNVNNAASWTSISTGLPTSGDYIDVSTGDFDDDGNVDILTAGSYASTYGIHVYYGDGNSWTENSGPLPTDRQYIGNAVGDVNRDGSLDILLGRYQMGGVEVWKNLGSVPQYPTVSSTSPADLATNVPLNAGISITFGVSMNTSATEKAISADPNLAWHISWSSSDTVITLTPQENLEPSTQYIITVNMDAKGTNDLNLESLYEFSFTTGSALDTAPPVVSGTVPIDDAEGVSPAEEIVITFSEPMDTGATESAFSVTPGTIVKTTWEDDGTQVVITVDMEEGATYIFSISMNAKDVAGNSIASTHTFSFTTTSEVGSDNESGSSDSQVAIFLIIPIIVIIILVIVFMKKKK